MSKEKPTKKNRRRGLFQTAKVCWAFFVSASRRLTTALALIVCALFLVFLPGQNALQTQTLTPQPQPEKNLSPSLHVPIPVPKSDRTLPQLSARAAIIIDVPSASVLFAHEENTRLAPASTTKIMTALVAFEQFDLNEVVTVRNTGKAVGQTTGLLPTEQITVENLLYALLVSSGNDAAVALAEHFPKGYNAFVARMNQKAKELHLQDTHFTNVSGLDQPNHFTSVKDLSLLTKEALKNPVFSSIVDTKQKNIANIDGTIIHRLTSTNQLLGSVAGVKGVKTGWTEGAGECLVTSVSRDGRELIIVVLGSIDRFGETESLIAWTFANYTWIDPQEVISRAP